MKEENKREESKKGITPHDLMKKLGEISDLVKEVGEKLPSKSEGTSTIVHHDPQSVLNCPNCKPKLFDILKQQGWVERKSLFEELKKAPAVCVGCKIPLTEEEIKGEKCPHCGETRYERKSE